MMTDLFWTKSDLHGKRDFISLRPPQGHPRAIPKLPWRILVLPSAPPALGFPYSWQPVNYSAPGCKPHSCIPRRKQHQPIAKILASFANPSSAYSDPNCFIPSSSNGQIEESEQSLIRSSSGSTRTSHPQGGLPGELHVDSLGEIAQPADSHQLVRQVGKQLYPRGHRGGV